MEFLEVSEHLTYSEISSIENLLKISFTDEFKEHYTNYNGGYPFKRFFQWPNGDITRINHFFSLKYNGFTQLEEVYNDLLIVENILPVGYIPFASDDGADFFCLSVLPDRYNHVYFCDMYHYDPQNIDVYLTLLSLSFKNFINNLTEG
jgi:hypothetical protein